MLNWMQTTPFYSALYIFNTFVDSLFNFSVLCVESALIKFNLFENILYLSNFNSIWLYIWLQPEMVHQTIFVNSSCRVAHAKTARIHFSDTRVISYRSMVGQCSTLVRSNDLAFLNFLRPVWISALWPHCAHPESRLQITEETWPQKHISTSDVSKSSPDIVETIRGILQRIKSNFSMLLYTVIYRQTSISFLCASLLCWRSTHSSQAVTQLLPLPLHSDSSAIGCNSIESQK